MDSISPIRNAAMALCPLLSIHRYSDKYPFRMRSETPDIAIELSMQVRVHIGSTPTANLSAARMRLLNCASLGLVGSGLLAGWLARSQPWRAFKPDGVIFFSDILTPLPAMGIEFDVVKGKGPIIATPVRSHDQVRFLAGSFVQPVQFRSPRNVQSAAGQCRPQCMLSPCTPMV
jgi:hypothetical protein